MKKRERDLIISALRGKDGDALSYEGIADTLGHTYIVGKIMECVENMNNVIPGPDNLSYARNQYGNMINWCFKGLHLVSVEEKIQ